MQCPIILNPRLEKDGKKYDSLRKNKGVFVCDDYYGQLRELFLARNPKLRGRPFEADNLANGFIEKRAARAPIARQGRWVYFPWNGCLTHILSKKEFYELRSARNKNLITGSEQELIKGFKVGIAGLSVGNSIALTLALEGFRSFALGDFDKISLSNLNRIRAGVQFLGVNKSEAAARQLYETDPYVSARVFERGVRSDADLVKFMGGLDLLVDEMDDAVMKVKLRESARRMKLPVVSAADNGDGVIADVERFDLERKREIFHGRLGAARVKRIGEMKFNEKMSLINDMVGAEYVTLRMKESFLMVGRDLYGWPQLGGAAMLAGSVIAYAAKKIALGEPLRSGKYDVSLDRVFIPRYDSPVALKRRGKETKKFLFECKKIFSGQG